MAVTSQLDMRHFETLQNKINTRLRELGRPYAHRQISDFPWAYGALGQVPSDVMFVAENPSLGGVAKADARTITGGPPCIEDQFCGGPTSNCIKRFRPALCELGLKSTPPLSLGGWHCYVTNAIKEAAIVREFAVRAAHDRRQLAIEWADILAWEMEKVRPRVLFTLGDRATDYVRVLRSRNLIPATPPAHCVMHYSNRGAGVTDHFVLASMIADIRAGLPHH